MVTRSPLTLLVEPMGWRTSPPSSTSSALAFPCRGRRMRSEELETNRLARYLVGRVGESRGLRWHLADGRRGPRHNVRGQSRVAPPRRRGPDDPGPPGRAIEGGAQVATLEVRLSNLPARNLYQRFGFRPVGVRPRYYSDDGEDALVMTTEPLGGLCGHGTAARAALGPGYGPHRDGGRSQGGLGTPVSVTSCSAVETSCDETPWRWSNAAAPSPPPSSRPRSRSMRRPEASCRRPPRAPICGGYPRCWRRHAAGRGRLVGRGRIAVTRGRVSRAPCWWVSRRPDARVAHGLAAGPREPPRGPPVRRVAHRPG